MTELREVVFRVRPDEAGERLDRMLARRLRGLSRRQIQVLIRDRLRPLTGGPARRLKPATLVASGLAFAVDAEVWPEPPLPALPAIYEDEAILVLDKPAGLAVHPAGRHFRCTVTAALAARPGVRAVPAHRLDRETSGLLLCGKGPATTSRLKRAFAAGGVRKTYQAICEGWPPEPSWLIDRPLALGIGQVRVRMAVGVGKPARTKVRCLGRYIGRDGQRFSLLSCQPETGRQHQIRAHLASVGLPLVGDKIYGRDETAFIRFTEGRLSPEDRIALRLDRHALHATSLSFLHPVSESVCGWTLPLPLDLTAFLAGLAPSGPEQEP